MYCLSSVVSLIKSTLNEIQVFLNVDVQSEKLLREIKYKNSEHASEDQKKPLTVMAAWRDLTDTSQDQPSGIIANFSQLIEAMGIEYTYVKTYNRL